MAASQWILSVILRRNRSGNKIGFNYQIKLKIGRVHHLKLIYDLTFFKFHFRLWAATILKNLAGTHFFVLINARSPCKNLATSLIT